MISKNQTGIVCVAFAAPASVEAVVTSASTTWRWWTIVGLGTKSAQCTKLISTHKTTMQPFMALSERLLMAVQNLTVQIHLKMMVNEIVACAYAQKPSVL